MINKIPGSESLSLDNLGRAVLPEALLLSLEDSFHVATAGAASNQRCTNSVGCGGTSNTTCTNKGITCDGSSNGTCAIPEMGGEE